LKNLTIKEAQEKIKIKEKIYEKEAILKIINEERG
jgi:hypothetical protein